VGTDSQPGSAFILTTHDAGQSWTPVVLPAGMSVVQAISCPSTAQCFALGGSQSSPTAPLAQVGILTNAPPG
jgi:hypothetical protein